MMPNYDHQKGVAHTLLLISLVGVIAFLLISNTFSFKDDIFAKLFTKKFSFASFSYYGNQVSTFQLFGQKSVGEASRNRVGSDSTYHASGAIVDRSSSPNRIYVVDTGNNRILGFNSFAQGKSADIVIGQADFTSTASCNGDNNLGFNKNPTASTLCLMPYPKANNTAEYWMRNNIDVDSQGNLYVVDVANNRVLKYNQPFSVDKTGGKGDGVADFVWGQPDFNSNKVNQGGSATNSTLWTNFGPPDHVSSRGVSVDNNGNVWVADTFNNRVLRFPANSKTADLVLGQSNFNTVGCRTNSINSALNVMCSPIVAKVDPETGDLYVVDEFPGGFHSRILLFRGPFTNGMSATRVITPKGTSISGSYDFTHVTGLTFNRYKVGDYAAGKFWIPDRYNRLILLDSNDNVIKTVGSKDANSVGGDQAFAGCPESIYTGKYMWTPGGSFGFDSDNNLIFADDYFGRVFKYSLPYTTFQNGTATCLPASSAYMLGGNPQTNDTLDEAVGMTVSGNQMIVVGGGNRLMAWNNYKTKDIGAPADVVINIPELQGRMLIAQSVDDQNRLWMHGTHGFIYIFNLPLQNGDRPVKTLDQLSWADDNVSFDYRGFAGMAFDPKTKAMYLVNGARILRVKNYANVLTEPLKVDMVIGQTNKTNNACNQGGAMGANTLCEPYQIAFDKLGNLYVVDNNYECHGNRRITVFTANDLANAQGMFPNLSAKVVFNAPNFTSSPNCAYWVTNAPGSPMFVAFNSKNQLVIGNDGYYGSDERELKQLWFYSNPLSKQTPDASIKLYMGTPGEMVFDSQDNLYIQDHTWYKVLGINLCTDPGWLSYLPNTPMVNTCGTVGTTATPTPGTTTLVGDINRNGRVDIFDYNLMLTDFGKSDSTSLRSDLNSNGRVDVFDYNLLLSHFGESL